MFVNSLIINIQSIQFQMSLFNVLFSSILSSTISISAFGKTLSAHTCLRKTKNKPKNPNDNKRQKHQTQLKHIFMFLFLVTAM